MGTYPCVSFTRLFAEFQGDVTVPRSVRVDRTRLDCNFVATCPHSTTTGLRPILMSAQTEAKKKPASNTWSYRPKGTDASAAPAEGMILPDAD